MYTELPFHSSHKREIFDVIKLYCQYKDKRITSLHDDFLRTDCQPAVILTKLLKHSENILQNSQIILYLCSCSAFSKPNSDAIY